MYNSIIAHMVLYRHVRVAQRVAHLSYTAHARAFREQNSITSDIHGISHNNRVHSSSPSPPVRRLSLRAFRAANTHGVRALLSHQYSPTVTGNRPPLPHSAHTQNMCTILARETCALTRFHLQPHPRGRSRARARAWYLALSRS